MTNVRGSNYTGFTQEVTFMWLLNLCNMGYTVTARVHNNKVSLGVTVACIYTSTTA